MAPLATLTACPSASVVGEEVFFECAASVQVKYAKVDFPVNVPPLSQSTMVSG